MSETLFIAGSIFLATVSLVGLFWTLIGNQAYKVYHQTITYRFFPFVYE